MNNHISLLHAAAAYQRHSEVSYRIASLFVSRIGEIENAAQHATTWQRTAAEESASARRLMAR